MHRSPSKEINIQVVLKQKGLIKRDRTLGHVRFSPPQLVSDEEGGTCDIDKTYQLVASTRSCPFSEIVLSFSGLPISSVAEDNVEPECVVSCAETSADGLQSAPVDDVVQLSNVVESALRYAESFTGTLERLNNAVNRMDGVIELVRNVSNVRSNNTTVSKNDRSLMQIHPISKVAVDNLTKVYKVRTLYNVDQSKLLFIFCLIS